MTDIVARAKDYLAHNAAESGADVLIKELCDEVESLRHQWLNGVTRILDQVKENKTIIDEATERMDRAGL
jgi:hypothetical protein